MSTSVDLASPKRARAALVASGRLTRKHVVKTAIGPSVFLDVPDEGIATARFQKDQIVFRQGEPADKIYFLRSGHMKVVVLSKQGKEAVVAMLEPGQFFGEGCLNDHAPRAATTTALSDCITTTMNRRAMMIALRDRPEFSKRFMTHLLNRNRRIEGDLVDQLFNSSEKRLARLLLLLARFGEPGSNRIVRPNISQEILADMIGTTRSRVSFFMNKFRKLGFISYGRKIEVHTSLMTAVLSDNSEINRS